ncbi:MAG: cell envelope integrity protein CreD [Lewinella sp.]|nr:cell envelope integrity protein CreD [Lewinella sp.]
MNTEKSFFERLNDWIKNSVTLKLVTITILMLLLLIPATMIRSIIQEREALNRQATEEVSAKWAEQQRLNGPILTIPLIYEYDQDDELVTKTRYWYILPEQLTINGSVEPETLRRGIYEVVVYASQLEVSGAFALDQQVPDPNDLKTIDYEHAFLTIGISDLRGIKDQIRFAWDNQNLDVEPGSRISDLIYSGITIDVPGLAAKWGQPADFSFALNLQGSQQLSFVPIGSQTDVRLTSPWTAPSFDGAFLPDSRTLSDNGFEASWSVLELNRNYPQSWISTDIASKLSASAFGVDLLMPLDNYQRSMRSAKYAVMTIALTFLVFFLVEVLNKRRIHPFQYALVGLALCLFYILLVSISEHLDFNTAYGIATAAVVLMVSLYSLSVFRQRRLSVILVALLLGIYGFLFVTIQLTDYALLIGSIGLSLILAATMYFTRNINWYKLNIEVE